MSADVRYAGDAALLLELDAVIDARVNARAVAVARRAQTAGIPGVRDVVPTYRTVAVHVDPLRCDVARVHDLLSAAAKEPPTVEAGQSIEVPVTYGGEAGPDLDAVAVRAGLSAHEVISLHAGVDYRVFMLGFLPGFAYLGTVDGRIAAPRLSTPRVRVPAGSVGIAGRQTGIYPIESPGGWQIVGRTLLRVFDVQRTPAALFAPGDTVRFVVDERGANPMGSPGEPERLAPRQLEAARKVTVLRPGLFTTVQDAGRWGYQASGVPVSGAMDPVAHRVANAVVGNQPDTATLEATLVGPELRFEQSVTIAVAGADLDASVDGAAVPLETAVRCRAGSVLRFGGRRAGARAYVAVDGGIAVPPVLGSRSTHALSAMGGVDGRALRAGDTLSLGRSVAAAPRSRRRDAGRQISGGARLRFVPGPQREFFSDAAFDALGGTRFTIAPQSDRVGYRLHADRPVPVDHRREMISDATFGGAIQVPPSGQPILLMADRQTTGGYPQIGIVITADLSKAAQLAPGDWIEFEPCSRAQAMAALVEQESRLLAIA